MKLFRVATTVAALLAGSLLASAAAEASAVKKKSYEVVEIDARAGDEEEAGEQAQASANKAKLRQQGTSCRKQAAQPGAHESH